MDFKETQNISTTYFFFDLKSSAVISANQIYMAAAANKMCSDTHTKEKCDRNQFFA